MAELFDHIEYLSCEIGARPAGTEEEQEAALYIAEQFQKEVGFHAEIEEFASASNLEGGRALLAAVVFVVSILAMIFNMLAIPAFVLALVATVIYVLEAFDKPFVSRALARGASQNIVAKYLPGGDNGGVSRNPRSRKLVVVAHYDTGKVKPKIVERVESMGLPIGYICVGGMVAATLFLLIRIVMGGSGGPAIAFLNVLTILSLIIVAAPIAKGILYRMAPYNEGANNNATGVAAMIEIAQRISSGSMSEADLADGDIVVHGEEAALRSGLVPEGAEIVYETEPMTEEEFDEQDDEGRLLAAKAAIAALTGQPVENKVYAAASESRARDYDRWDDEGDFGEDTGDYGDIEAYGATYNESAFEEIPANAAPVPAPAQDAAGFHNVPSWFAAAQKNARKSEEPVQVQRSRYTDAIEVAERAAAERERARLEREAQQREEERRLREEASRAALEARFPKQETVVAAPEADQEPAQAAPALAEEPVEQAPAVEVAPVEAEVVEEATVEDAAIEEVAVEEATAFEPVVVRGEQEEPEAAEPAVADEAEDVAEEPVAEPAEEEPVAELGQTTAFTPVMVSLEDLPSDEELDAYYEQDENNELQSAIDKLANLPAVDQSEPAAQPAVPENANPSRSGLFRKLRTDVPSLSGAIRAQNGEEPAAQLSRAAIPEVKAAIPQVPVQSAPETVDYDMELPLHADEVPAGDSVQPASVEQAPARAERPEPEPEPQPEPVEQEQGEVEMPSSRAGGFFSRFRRHKNEKLEESPQEWLDVDEDFDARTVGRERGGWESFQEGAPGSQAGSRKKHRAGDDWNGGAFSRIRLGHVNTRSGAEEEADVPEELVEAEEDRALNDEIEQIIHFRNPLFTSDIWFVALGSDTDLHDGAKAFASEHADELRGAMIIEVESLGAGALSFASEEGLYKKVKSSSRLKRFARPATEATGIALDRVSLAGTDSISSTLQKEGYQVMHLFGAEDGKPALKGSADDVIENVDDLILEENVGFLMELLRHGQ